MPSVTTSFEKFVASIFGIISSIITSIFAFFQSLLALGQGAIHTAWALVRETISFAFNNALIILIVAGAFIAFGAYQQRVQAGKSGMPTVAEIKQKTGAH